MCYHWEYRQIGRPAFSEFTGKLVKKYLKLYSARIKSVQKGKEVNSKIGSLGLLVANDQNPTCSLSKKGEKLFM